MTSGQPSNDAVIARLEKIVQAEGSKAAFEFLAGRFAQEKDYSRLFEIRLMKKRWELGLPLVWAHSLDELSTEIRSDYEAGYVQAAREVGSLFLADGEIASAWPYLQAIGEAERVAEAIESYDSKENVDRVIEIAFHEAVHPRKGLQLILEHYGLCRAISSFSQYPSRKGRSESLQLLIKSLYADLVSSLKATVARQEGDQPDSNSLAEILEGRDWLFGNNGYHIDTSHLNSVVRFSLEVTDRETLASAVELADYGSRLSSLFQCQEHPPFDDGYSDYAIYIRALLGEEEDRAIEHFRRKVASLDAAEFGSHPAQVLVELLVRLERFPDAVEVFLENLMEVPPSELSCASINQLCQMAGQPQQLMSISRGQSDVLGFAAGLLQTECSGATEE